MKLKLYQETALATLQRYLETACFKGAKFAYDELQYERFQSQAFKPYQPLLGLEETPYVCLRLPTGGGKTLLSAHTVKLAASAYSQTDHPLTLWLVPTDIIRTQTLETLKNPAHPNYQVLNNAFNGRFRVFDIADFRQIRPQDISDSSCIIVATFQALRVDKTEGRKVYAHDENLEAHFSKVLTTLPNMERDEQTNKLKYSLVNLLHWHKPLVIIDEAHNAKSDLSVEVLNRINASCVIEYTATPANNSNIIVSISAAELKAEQMIKLPIIFSEHTAWQQAITASIQTQQKLEQIAIKDTDYIRPIVLFQAENKGQETTVEVLKKYLLEQEGIPENQIAIATGEQRELDEINLFDHNCPIRYVITVQALKEGWDCSFAYVLCSVANTKSKTAVEQLLGRVLRMPYVKLRTQAELNKAYAHVSANSWPHAISELHDRLVSMGFEQQEAEEFIWQQPSFDINQAEPIANKPLNITLSHPLDLTQLTFEEQKNIAVQPIEEQRFALQITGGINNSFAERIANAATDKQDKREILLAANSYLIHWGDKLAPAQKGEIFLVPQLCLNFADGVELAEPELYLTDSGWNLLDYYAPLTSNFFSINEQTKQYVADLSGKKIMIKAAENVEQFTLDGIYANATELDLVRWLDRRLRQPDIKQKILLEFLRRTVRDLLDRNDLTLEKLLRGKFILEKVLRERIDYYRKQAYHQGYQQCMFSETAIATINKENFSFKFDCNNYPANLLYEGPIGFNKHYYSRIAMMNAEEAECAQAIDQNPTVKFWVRNLERQPLYAFWLPTSTDRFYPDFIAQLVDGRLLVIEYKGAHLNNEDTQEKALIGKVWAEKSGNLFLIAWKKDKHGENVYQQINKLIS